MSKRFGRNQKRRMREQIARVTAAHALDQGLLRRTTSRLRDVQDEVNRAKRIVGEHSGLFDPVSMTLPGRRSRIEIPLCSAGLGTTPLLGAVPDVAFRSIPLDMLLAETRTDPSTCGHHVIVRYGEHQWGYAFDRETLATAAQRMMAVIHIAETLARQIVADLGDTR